MQFQFVNSFLALFYTAFYLQDIEKLKEVGLTAEINRNLQSNVFSAFGSTFNNTPSGGKCQGREKTHSQYEYLIKWKL